MQRSKKVRSSRRLDEVEWEAKEAEDGAPARRASEPKGGGTEKRRMKKTRSSLSLSKFKPSESSGEVPTSSSSSSSLASSSSSTKKASSSSSKKDEGISKGSTKKDTKSKQRRQKVKVQFEIAFIGIRDLPAKLAEDGSRVLVRWKGGAKVKQPKSALSTAGDATLPVRNKAETQAIEVKKGGRAGWQGAGAGPQSEGERFLFEEKLKYDEGSKTFEAGKSIELVIKQIKGKKKNHLYKTKVDVGEFAHHGSTTKQEIVFGKPSAKEPAPVLTVVFRAKWLMIGNKVLVKKSGAGAGNVDEDYDLLTVNETDMSETESESDLSESDSDMSESESDMDSDEGSTRRSSAVERARKKCEKLETRCTQLETILLETKKELAEAKVENMQIKRQLKEKEDQLSQSQNSTTSSKPSSSYKTSDKDLKKALEERDQTIAKLEEALKSKDEEVKAVKGLFQAEIEEMKKAKRTTDSDEEEENDDEQEEEWQRKVDRVAALYDFKARNDQEITLTKDEEFYVTDRDPYGVGNYASEWWRVVRRIKTTSTNADPGQARQEGLAPITYFRITRPAEREMKFKVSTKRTGSIMELQRHCGFLDNGKKAKKKEKAKREEVANEGTGDDLQEENNAVLKSLQKDRPMQQGKRLPSRFASLRRMAKDRMKVGDHFGGKQESQLNLKSESNSPEKKQNPLSLTGEIATREVYLSSNAETNQVLKDLQKELEGRAIIEKAVYCADVTRFIPISDGPAFLSSSSATPTRLNLSRNKRSSGKGDGSDDDSISSNDKHTDMKDMDNLILEGVQELMMYIRSRKVLEDSETSLSFIRPLCTALRATVQRSKSNGAKAQASALSFVTGMLHCLKAQKSYFHLPPFSDDRDKLFQALFVDPKDQGLIIFIEDVPKRKKLLKMVKKKMEKLSESEERSLGGYTLLVRTLIFLALDSFLALMDTLKQECVPGLVYAMLERPVDLSDLIFGSSQEDNNNTRLEVATKQLSRLHAQLIGAGLWSKLLNQIYVDLFQAIDVRLFNVIVERSDLCVPNNGYQIKTAILQFAQWAESAQNLDTVAIKKQLAHVEELSSLLVLDLSVITEEADVQKAFPTLTPRQVLHFASSCQPDGSSTEALNVLRKMTAHITSSKGAGGKGGSSLKLDLDVPPLRPSKADYRRPLPPEALVFHETI